MKIKEFNLKEILLFIIVFVGLTIIHFVCRGFEENNSISLSKLDSMAIYAECGDYGNGYRGGLRFINLYQDLRTIRVKFYYDDFFFKVVSNTSPGDSIYKGILSDSILLVKKDGRKYTFAYLHVTSHQ